MYNSDVLNKIEMNLNNDMQTNLNCSNIKYDDFKNYPQTFDR